MPTSGRSSSTHKNAVVADFLKRRFHSREVDGAVAERAECAHFVCILCGLQSVGVYVFEMHVRKARADFLDELDGGHARKRCVCRIDAERNITRIGMCHQIINVAFPEHACAVVRVETQRHALFLCVSAERVRNGADFIERHLGVCRALQRTAVTEIPAVLAVVPLAADGCEKIDLLLPTLMFSSTSVPK